MSVIKASFFLITLLMSNIFYSQEKKDSIVVFFNPSTGDLQSNESGVISFVIKGNESEAEFHHKLVFRHDLKLNKKKNVKFKQVKDKLISGEQAIEKVNNYLELRAKKCEEENLTSDNTPCQLLRHPPAYAYNSYFEKIYIYEKIGKNKGVLYEVSWDWFMVD